MKLIVGLGNPDKGYARNRHNAGFMALDHLAHLHHIEFQHRHCQSRVGAGRIGAEPAVLAKPQTYMNLSGEAVRALRKRYEPALEDILIVHDDMDLPLGRIRIRLGGQPAGHNGIRSIIASLGGPDFPRLRIGVGHPRRTTAGRRSVVNYVLGDFDPTEQELFEKVLDRAGEAIAVWAARGLEAAMNGFNPGSLAPDSLEKEDKEGQL
jgi:PTH1 family peptidyl-tRNA hydrolase